MAFTLVSCNLYHFLTNQFYLFTYPRKITMKRLLFFLCFFALGAMQMWAGGPDDIQSDTVWTRYTHSNLKVKFSPDGNYIASLGGDLIFFNLQGYIIHRIPGLYEDFNYSKDGKYIVLINHAAVKGKQFFERYWLELYETNTWEKIDSVFIDTLKIVTPPTVKCNISPNDSILAVFGPFGIKFYNLRGEIIKKILNTPDSQTLSNVYVSEFTNDGKYLIYLSITDELLKFINMDSLKIEFTYPHLWNHLAISADSKLIAFTSSNYDGYAVLVMDLNTREIITKIPGRVQDVSSITISPDNRYIAISQEMNDSPYYRLNIYYINNGSFIYSNSEINGLLPCLDWDKNFIVGGSGNYLILYNTSSFTGFPENPKSFDTFIIPNPANNFIEVDLGILIIEDININIVNNIGDVVKSFSIKNIDSGQQKIKINVNDLPSGNYLINVQANIFQKTYKLIINK